VFINPATPVPLLGWKGGGKKKGFGGQKFIPGALHKIKTLAEFANSLGLEEEEGGGSWDVLPRARDCLLPATPVSEKEEEGGGSARAATILLLSTTKKKGERRAAKIFFFTFSPDVAFSENGRGRKKKKKKRSREISANPPFRFEGQAQRFAKGGEGRGGGCPPNPGFTDSPERC